MDPSTVMTEIVRNLKDHWVFGKSDPFKFEGRYAILLFNGISDSFPIEKPDEVWDETESTLLAYIELSE